MRGVTLRVGLSKIVHNPLDYLFLGEGSNPRPVGGLNGFRGIDRLDRPREVHYKIGQRQADGPGSSHSTSVPVSFQVAEPVVTLSGTGAEGGYASVTVADAAMTVSLDGTGIGPAAAVAAVPNAATAHAALTEVAHLKPGERVLVHGALGGLASAFPGVARTLGAASVTGTARSSSLAAARASALPYDEVIASEDLLTALGGQRFDVVIDPVGGQVRTDSLKVMAPLGRMLLVGNASGDWQHTVATNDLWLGSLAIAGFSSGYYFPAHPGQAQPAAQGAINAISQGLVDITTQIFPLAEAAEAHRRAETGSVAGRILLAP